MARIPRKKISRIKACVGKPNRTLLHCRAEPGISRKDDILCWIGEVCRLDELRIRRVCRMALK